MLEWRLKAYRAWLTMEEVTWAKLDIPPIDFQDAYYYAEPRQKPTIASLDELDPEIRRTYEKLGIPIEEQKVLAGVEGARKVAVDAVFDSVSVATTFREELKSAGVIFLSISEAVREYPELVRKYLGSVVPQRDNYFACLNSAVFSDGTFVYIPEGRALPDGALHLFPDQRRQYRPVRAHPDRRRQGSATSPIWRAAPRRCATRTSSTPPSSSWSPSTMPRSNIRPSRTGIRAMPNGLGGIYNFVTKRGACRGARSKISWTQVETGSAITWKYPSCILQGESERRRILFGRFDQQPPAGRYRHQDDPYRQEQPLDHRLQGHQRRPLEQHLPGPRPGPRQCRERAQPHPVRLASARRPMRRPHRPLYRGPQPLRPDRARGDDVEDQRRPALLRHAARPLARRMPSPSSSTASPARCSSSCRWSSRSRRRNCSASASRGASDDRGPLLAAAAASPGPVLYSAQARSIAYRDCIAAEHKRRPAPVAEIGRRACARARTAAGRGSARACQLRLGGDGQDARPVATAARAHENGGGNAGRRLRGQAAGLAGAGRRGVLNESPIPRQRLAA